MQWAGDRDEKVKIKVEKKINIEFLI